MQQMEKISADKLEPSPGIEPGTYSLQVSRSTNWAKMAKVVLNLQ